MFPEPHKDDEFYLSFYFVGLFMFLIGDDDIRCKRNDIS